MEHKYRVSKCAFGNESIGGNCVVAMVSKIRGITPKFSNYNLTSNSTCSSGSSFNPNPNPKTESIPKTDGAPPLVPQSITKTESIPKTEGASGPCTPAWEKPHPNPKVKPND